MEKHFVLVHGGCNGAWGWYKVASILKSAGHKVSALDMASCGINPKQVHEIRSLSDYFQPLIEFLESLPPQEKVILVGHNHGCRGISIAMERFPDKISVAVFASAQMHGPNLNLSTCTEEYYRSEGPLFDVKFDYADGSENPATSVLFGPKILSSRVYHLSPPEMLAAMLVRPHQLFNDPAMLDAMGALTEERYGAVCRFYVVCPEDMVIKEDLQRWMIQHSPVDEEFVIYGSDHMLMCSKPQEFSAILQGIARKYE
ncbi:methyl jasmonate esterase 1-like [Rutidosis leptorrhynchoides]|uniref:methyl jasmonate esterase 1-like n=1 Tax=Rutidosis leptorrhynchoides TaxID=125765 RepID=UPI003A9A4D67